MGWVVEYNDGVDTHTYEITQMTFKKSLSGINSGNFRLVLDSSGDKCPVDKEVIVKLKDSVSQSGDVTILYGVTTKVGEVNKGLYQVTIAERANDLKKYYVEDDTTGFKVTVSDANAKISDYVYAILNTGKSADTGWYIHSSCVGTGTIGDYTNVPILDGTWDGAEGTDDIPSQVYINSNCAASLDKFLHDICGIKFWFDNDNKYIYYGYFRNETAINIDNIIIDNKQIDDVTDAAIDRIVIISTSDVDSGAKYIGEAVAVGATQPYKSVIYQYDSATSNNDCELIATQLLAEQENVKIRYEFTLPIDSDGLLCKEGSTVTLDSTDYIVQDVTFTLNSIVVGVDSRQNNFSDVFNSKSNIVNSGGAEITVGETWTGGLQNIGAPETNYLVTEVDTTNDYIYFEDASDYSVNDRISFTSTGSVPGGITANEIYYIISVNTTDDYITISTTYGGSKLNITSDGSGNIRCRNLESASIPAIYNIDIDNVDNIDNFSVTCDFDYYKEGINVGDEVEFLSAPSLISNSGELSVGIIPSTSINYLPSSTGVECDKITTGFQHGFTSLTLVIKNSNYVNSSCVFTIQCQVNYHGTWSDVGEEYQFVYRCGQVYIGGNTYYVANNSSSFSFSNMFSGSNVEETADGDIKVRYKLTSTYTGTSLNIENAIVSVDRVPRHKHTIDKDYNVAGSIYPRNVYMKITNIDYTDEYIPTVTAVDGVSDVTQNWILYTHDDILKMNVDDEITFINPPSPLVEDTIYKISTLGYNIITVKDINNNNIIITEEKDNITLNVIKYQGIVSGIKNVELQNYLRTGSNKITMFTETPGSVYLNGSYDNFNK